MKIDKNTVIVFDLDDTLYKEIEFVKSAYREIARIIELQIGIYIYDELIKLFTEKENVFETILSKYSIKLSLQDLIDIYRYHIPIITPIKEIMNFINRNKNIVHAFSLITDGKSVTQRNKLSALGLTNLFNNNVFISQEVGFDKLNEYSFLEIIKKFPRKKFIYFADNAKKDFIIANKLGWVTYQIQDKNNIHDSFIEIPLNYAPKNNISYKFFENDGN
jgi:putative hydrolase of the HAD superfamily